MSDVPNHDVTEVADDGGEIIECWCGARGTYEQLFDDDFDDGCGGSGTLTCHCGGDFCSCHNHGEAECPGCPDCDDGEDEDYDDEHEHESDW